SWKKELTALNFCSGRGTTISTHDSNRGPVSMRLHRSNCADTVIMRKEKLFQGMVDVYHFDPFRFWPLWAGKIITINWYQDLVWGSFPPVCNFPCVPTNTVSSAGVLYDTDGKADIAVWRSTTGEWIIINSLTGQTRVVQWGTSGDQPAPGDYDGDGKTDLAVYRSATGTWYIKGYITGVESIRTGGTTTDIAVAADYDGDRKTDPAVWTYATSVWSIYTNPPRN